MEKQLTALPVNSIITDAEWQQAYRRLTHMTHKKNSYTGLL